MQGVGPGTLLGGRYDLRIRLSPGGVLERWSAQDTTLEREVALTIISSEHPNRAGVLDAARRAAGVEDTRLVRILDVGTQSDHSFIVEEALSESQSLATILLQGPLPAEEARRVAGETAKGLEAAGQRGLHHLRLTPGSVLIAPDGGVRVRGVAVAAATDGPDEQEPDSSSAARRDAVCLVALVYAGLTSRWPLDDPLSDVQPAPRGANGAVAPSEIAAGVPNDLDSLCRITLNEATGPASPGEFAGRIAPWPREPVRRATVEPTVALRLPSSTDLPDDVPAGAAGAAGAGGWGGAGGSEPTVALSTHDVLSFDPARRAESTEPTEVVQQPEQPGQSRQPEHAEQPVQPVQPVHSAASNGVGAASGPTVSDKASAAGAATKALGAALASAGAAAGAVGGKLGSFARTAGDRDAAAGSDQRTERMSLPAGLHQGQGPRGSNDSHGHSNSSTTQGPGPERSPFPDSPARPSRGQALIVVLVVGSFVAVALFFGYRGLVGQGTDVTLRSPSPRPVGAAPPARVPDSPAPETSAPAASSIAILSATGFDPEGDEKEGNSKAGRVYDGDIDTSWTSERYVTAEFGNLKKGVGVLVDLGQPTSVNEVALNLGSAPADVTVYAAADPSLDGATEIGSSSGADGQIKVKAKEALPEAQYIIVWFTALASDGGQYRASLAEIALS